MTSAAFDRFTDDELALAGEGASECELSAYKKEAAIRRRLRWLLPVHRLATWRAARILRRLDPGGEIRESVERAELKLRGYKVVFLHALLRRLRPRLVLEFGSGGSTPFIAAVLRANQREFGAEGRLVSFEQAPDYHQRVQTAISDALRPWVDVRLSPVRFERIGGWRAIRYAMNCDFGGPVDLAYVDGPAPVRGHGQHLSSPIFSGDVLALERSGVPVRHVATDVRYFNYGFFADVLKDTHDVKVDLVNRSVVATRRRARH